MTSDRSEHGEPAALQAQDILDALGDAAVVLDHHATIVATNDLWNRFCHENGGNPSTVGVGINYLDVCRRSAEAGSQQALHAGDCVRRVLRRLAAECLMEYECSSPTERRWFVLRVAAVGQDAALASHINITARRQAERRAAVTALPSGADRDGTTAILIDVFADMSAAEREVVARLLRGYRVNAIAAELFVSPSTVRSQLSSVFAKVGVSSQQELIDLVRSDLAGPA